MLLLLTSIVVVAAAAAVADDAIVDVNMYMGWAVTFFSSLSSVFWL